MPPPEGKRRGLRRLVPGRRRREEPGAEQSETAALATAEPDAVDAVADEAVADETEDTADVEPPTEEDELAARFDAARERLRATIKPPPDDG